jgi:hypothetical protein
MRAQLNYNLLIYVFGIIIVSIVIIFGFISIKSFNKTSNTEVVLFKNSIQKDVNEIKSSYSAEKFGSYSLPTGFYKVCFVDLEKVDYRDIAANPIVKDSVKNNVRENVFLISEGNLEALYLESMEIPRFPHYTCIVAPKGSIKLQLIGTGEKAQLIPPTSQEYCKNAEDSELCEGLDVVFGHGYKNDCCEDFTLCCEV